MLKCWNFSMLKSWNVEMLNVWEKFWNVEILNFSMLKGGNVENVKRLRRISWYGALRFRNPNLERVPAKSTTRVYGAPLVGTGLYVHGTQIWYGPLRPGNPNLVRALTSTEPNVGTGPGFSRTQIGYESFTSPEPKYGTGPYVPRTHARQWTQIRYGPSRPRNLGMLIACL